MPLVEHRKDNTKIVEEQDDNRQFGHVILVEN